MTGSITYGFDPAIPRNVLRGKRILLVEDSPTIQFFTKAILEKYGCIVDIARDGEHALEKISGKKFDMIFMDYYLPKISGLEVTAQIRSTENENTETPIVAFTGEESADVVSESFKSSGMDGYVMKPINEPEMLETMRQLLDKKTS